MGVLTNIGGAAAATTYRLAGGTGRMGGSVIGGLARMAGQRIAYDFLGPIGSYAVGASRMGGMYGGGFGFGGIAGYPSGYASSSIGGVANTVNMSNQILLRIYNEIRRVQSVKLDNINSNLAKINSSLMDLSSASQNVGGKSAVTSVPMKSLITGTTIGLIAFALGEGLKSLWDSLFGGGESSGSTRDSRSRTVEGVNASQQRAAATRDMTPQERMAFGDPSRPDLAEPFIERQRAQGRSQEATREGLVPQSPIRTMPPGIGSVKEDQISEAGVRKLPLSPRLRGALDEVAAKMGIEVRVKSGGQMSLEDAMAAGAVQRGDDWFINGKKVRTGSTRHDDGNAADIEIYKNGKLISFKDPEGQKIFSEFATELRRRGVSGIGAGEGYMGDTGSRMHVGYGSDMTWGAGGKRANTPDWLKKAYEAGLESTSQPPAESQQNNTGDEMEEHSFNEQLRNMSGSQYAGMYGDAPRQPVPNTPPVSPSMPKNPIDPYDVPKALPRNDVMSIFA